jgi:hypothetical protein
VTFVPTPDVPLDSEHAVMVAALRTISSGDCWSDESGDSCHCPVCEATWALGKVGSWRYEAAFSTRLTDGLHPREARIIAAWRAYMADNPDHRLSQVLHDRDNHVTRRDWYVATSVVQWLATNIGMLIVEAAGFKYTRFEEDRELVAQRIPPSPLPVGCERCDDEICSQRQFCGYCGRRLGGTR